MRLELTRRGDYAVRTMLALATNHPDRLSGRRIAADMGIPVQFVPHVLRDLARANLVEGTIGRSGGYRLARPADRITLLEIVEAAEGDAGQSTCVLRGGPCGKSGVCAVHDVFAGARASLLERLAATTLAEVADRD